MSTLISPFVYVLTQTESGDYDIYTTLCGALRAAVDAIEESFGGLEEGWFLHEAGEACGTPCKEAFFRYFVMDPKRLQDYGMTVESRCVRD